MLNYGISHENYELIFDKIEIDKRPMGVKGCKSVTNHRLHYIEHKMEMHDKQFKEYETEIENLKKYKAKVEKLEKDNSNTQASMDKLNEYETKIKNLENQHSELKSLLSNQNNNNDDELSFSVYGDS